MWINIWRMENLSGRWNTCKSISVGLMPSNYVAKDSITGRSSNTCRNVISQKAVSEHWLPTVSVLQNQYLRTTGSCLYLGQKRWAKFSVVLSPILALLFVVTECFMSSAKEKYWELGFYWYIFTVILLHAAWWWLVCSSLRIAMFGISGNFLKVHGL